LFYFVHDWFERKFVQEKKIKEEEEEERKVW